MKATIGNVIMVLAITVPIMLTLGAMAERESHAMKRSFFSMQSCLRGIERYSGQSIDFVSTDRPDKVTGLLSNKQFFQCNRKQTGTSGTYYEGIYWIKSPN